MEYVQTIMTYKSDRKNDFHLWSQFLTTNHEGGYGGIINK